MSRGFHARTDQEIESLADAAEAAGMCIDASGNPRLAKLLARRAKKGLYVEAYPTAYVRAETWKCLTYCERARMVVMTVARRHPNWVFCLESAAVFHGLQVSRVNWAVIHVLAKKGDHTKDTAHVIHHVLLDTRTIEIDGVHATTLWQTTVSYLAERDFAHGLAVADSALKLTGAQVPDLYAHIDAELSDEASRVIARATAQWSDPKSDNGGESYARGIMLNLGFERPELQVHFTDPADPSVDYYADFLWHVKGGVIVAEMDGKGKYLDERMTAGKGAFEVMQDERIRESRITFQCKGIIRFRFREVDDPDGFRGMLLAYGIPMRGQIGTAGTLSAA